MPHPQPLPDAHSWRASAQSFLASYWSLFAQSSSFQSQMHFSVESFPNGTDLSAIDAERHAPPIEARFYQRILTGAKGIYELHVFADRSPPFFELCNRRADLPNQRMYAEYKVDLIDEEILEHLPSAWDKWINRIDMENDENAFEKSKRDVRAMDLVKNVQKIVIFMANTPDLEIEAHEVANQ
jgi:hypothetical protein